MIRRPDRDRLRERGWICSETADLERRHHGYEPTDRAAGNGEHVRLHAVESRDGLTAQKRQIAELAAKSLPKSGFEMITA